MYGNTIVKHSEVVLTTIVHGLNRCVIYFYITTSNSDNNIMPIEEVTTEPEDQMSSADKLSAREEFWYRELMFRIPIWT